MKHKKPSMRLNFVDARYRATNWSDNNLCPPPTPAQEAVNYLCEYMLGKDYYIAMPLNNDQANTVIVSDILAKYIDQPTMNIGLVKTLVCCAAVGIFFAGVLVGIVL